MIRALSLALAALLVFTSPGLTQVIPIGGGGSGSVTQTTNTWTPTYTSSGGSGSPTYNTQVGNYTKTTGPTGSVVVVTFYIRSTALTGLSGTLQIGGLPFTSSNDTEYPGACDISAYQGFTFAASTTQLLLGVLPNSTIIEINNAGSGVSYSNQTVAGATSNALIYATCTYRTP